MSGPSLDKNAVAAKEAAEHVASALERFDQVTARLSGRDPAFFLDYDGTLAPIAAHPAKAVLETGMQQVLRRLATRWPMAIISGRAVSDVYARTGVEQAVYAGDHGMMFLTPSGEQLAPGLEDAHLAALAHAAKRLKARLDGTDGVWVETKSCTLSVHTRQASPGVKTDVERVVDETIAEEPLLRKTLGKDVVELQPSVAWDKGKALVHLFDRWQSTRPGLVPVVLGDDRSDEAAFAAVQGHGVGVFVGTQAGETAADFSLADPGEVREFLERLESWLNRA